MPYYYKSSVPLVSNWNKVFDVTWIYVPLSWSLTLVLEYTVFYSLWSESFVFFFCHQQNKTKSHICKQQDKKSICSSLYLLRSMPKTHDQECRGVMWEAGCSLAILKMNWAFLTPPLSCVHGLWKVNLGKKSSHHLPVQLPPSGRKLCAQKVTVGVENSKNIRGMFIFVNLSFSLEFSNLSKRQARVVLLFSHGNLFQLGNVCVLFCKIVTLLHNLS